MFLSKWKPFLIQNEYEPYEILADTFSDIYRARYQLHEIPVIYHSITRYNLELRIINDKLLKNQELENRYGGLEIKTIPLYRFYVDKLELMVDTVAETTELLENIHGVWNYIEENKSHVNQFPEAYNLRILKFIDNNLEEIIQQLSKYSEAVRNEHR